MKLAFKLLILLFPIFSWGQIQVNGTVISKSNKIPIIDVLIQIQGTDSGTTTGLDGEFSIHVPYENSILIFSSLGYFPQEVNLKGQVNITILLKEECTHCW